jgi:hypothetical protein
MASHPSSQASTIPAIDPSAAPTSNLKSTFMRLGLGKKPADRSQAISLEAEVNSYLAVPTSFHEDVVMFWQVCSNVSWIEEYLTPA